VIRHGNRAQIESYQHFFGVCTRENVLGKLLDANPVALIVDDWWVQGAASSRLIALAEVSIHVEMQLGQPSMYMNQ
jgi:hypothetical protein